MQNAELAAAVSPQRLESLSLKCAAPKPHYYFFYLLDKFQRPSGILTLTQQQFAVCLQHRSLGWC